MTTEYEQAAYEQAEAYELALAVAAKVYDRQALAARNEREGLAAARLAEQHADILMTVHCWRRGLLHGEEEYLRADGCREVLKRLHQNIGARAFMDVCEHWRKNNLIEGIDY